jgi:Domain of unknown function (DUF4440)
MANSLGDSRPDFLSSHQPDSDAAMLRLRTVFWGLKNCHQLEISLKAIDLLSGLALVATVSACTTTSEKAAIAQPAKDALFETISALDNAAFDAFNHCSSPEQLQKHASYFTPDVEFYHDNGGVTWTRDAMLANTQKHVCGHFRRELIPDSLKVFPIKDFGAIAQGLHRFCQFDTGECDGLADFVIVWRKQGEQWLMTRVLSYGHRTSKQSMQ